MTLKTIRIPQGESRSISADDVDAVGGRNITQTFVGAANKLTDSVDVIESWLIPPLVKEVTQPRCKL